MTTPAPTSPAPSPLPLHLLGATSPPPLGRALKAPGGLMATLVDEGGRLVVRARLPERPVTELRWLVDGVLRRVKALTPISGELALEVDPDVSREVAVAIALDLLGAPKVTLQHALGDEVDGIAGALAECRRWVNEDPATRTSTAIANDIRAFVDRASPARPLTLEVLDRAACEAAGLNLLVAVGGASRVSPPTLVICRYTPEGATLAPWMLLGKGITFDTGGINVKPYESFVSMMKNDMAGAATAFALFRHLVEAGHARPLTLVIPTCENAVGEEAMRPGALVRSHRGHLVRIDHTDAEGRLIMADALSYASERYPAERVLTFATLTTAALIAYGPYATPVHFPEPAFEDALARASAATGEDLHFFPARIWHTEANRDPEADLRNTARLPGHASGAAGSRNAAHFLPWFTDVPLTHFDIFASGWNWAGDAPGIGYGATGAPLHTLIRAMRDGG